MPAIYKNGKNYGGGTTVDPALSSISSNPVQNKVVKQALDELILNFANYYNKTEVDSIVNAIKNSRFEVVATLPTTDIKTNVIYLVPKSPAQTNNVKDEYINLDGTSSGWEKIGDTEIDLSGYVTTTALNTALSDYTTTTDLTTLLNNKVDKVTGKVLSTNDYTNTEKQKNADNASAIEDIQEDISTSLTATGNPITIESSESNLVECTAEVEPVQDLHGYDHPWVGGAGKNLIKMTLANLKSFNTTGTWNGNTYTYNGITYTPVLDSDGNVTGIKANGTSSDASSFVLDSELSASENCILTGGKSIIMTIQTRFTTQPFDWTPDHGSGATLDMTRPRFIFIYISSNFTLNNEIFKPMVRLQSVTDATFEPYENKSSIIGQTEVVIEDCGKNLFDVTNAYNGYIDANGEFIAYNGVKASSYFRVEPNKNYTLSYYRDNTGMATGMRIAWYDKNKNFIRRDGEIEVVDVGNKSITATCPNNGRFARISLPYTNEINKLQLELGNTTTDFEPYKGKTYRVEIGQKNKLPMTVDGIKSANTSGTWNGNVYTLVGITFTILTDSDNNVIGIRCNGQASGSMRFYIFSGSATVSSGSKFNLNASKNANNYDAHVANDLSDIAYIVGTSAQTAETTLSDTTFTQVFFYFNSDYNDDITIYPMIRTTIDDSEFAPYNPNLPDTIYGGELDVVTGELRVTHGEVDLGDLDWRYVSGIFYANVEQGTRFVSNAICSAYENAGTGTDPANGQFGYGATYIQAGYRAIRINDTRYTDATTFKTAVTGQQLVYELATPYTIQLTPEQIRLLKGTNNISCNTGDLSIKYYPDNVLGQLKGDIESEYDERITELEEKANTPIIKQIEINRNAVSTDGSVMFTSLTGHIIVGTSIENDSTGNKCVGIPYSMGNVPSLKIMNESTMAVLPNITISGTLYCIKL